MLLPGTATAWKRSSSRSCLLALPLLEVNLSAGFPSPAEEYLEEGQLDLNKHLVKHPSATFFVRVRGDSMVGAGIHSGDILVVDCSLKAKDGNVVVAVINEELVVKRLRLSRGQPCLMAENAAFAPIEIKEGMEFRVWGVVTAVIHQV